MLQAVRSAFTLQDLRNKLLVTIGILVLYRLCAHIPLPGVDATALGRLFTQDPNILLNMLNFFSGGALAQMGVMALGVYPYITASIIMQLLVPMVPQLQELSKEGEHGRAQISKYTYYITVPLAIIYAVGQATLLNSSFGGGISVFTNWGFSGSSLLPSLTIIIGMASGTMFAVWLGQLLTQQGIGNGVSLIIFAGIVSSLPQQVRQIIVTGRWDLLVIFSIITVLTIALIVWVNEGQRRIPVQYGKRVRAVRGNQQVMVGGRSTYIPMKINSTGMIPLIFAQSLLIFPSTLATFFTTSSGWMGQAASVLAAAMSPANWAYWLAYFLLVVAFTYFYADVMFRQQDLPNTLRNQGGYIMGLRPGPRTAEYLQRVLSRITFFGAIFLGFIAVLPFLVGLIFGGGAVSGGYSTLLISSAGLLIVVGVVLDTMRQIESQLMMRNYEGFIR
jgi:preprotein translocase subunit SecY